MSTQPCAADFGPRLPDNHRTGCAAFGIVQLLNVAEGTAIIDHLVKSLELDSQWMGRGLIIDLSNSDHLATFLGIPQEKQDLWAKAVSGYTPEEILSLDFAPQSDLELLLSDFKIPLVDKKIDLILFPPLLGDALDAWILALLKKLPDIIGRIRISKNDRYDFILLNLSPSLASEFRPILSIVNHVLVPFNCHEYLALDYLYDLDDLVLNLRHERRRIRIAGIFPIEFDGGADAWYDWKRMQGFIDTLFFPPINNLTSLSSNVNRASGDYCYARLSNQFRELFYQFPSRLHLRTGDRLRLVWPRFHLSQDHIRYNKCLDGVGGVLIRQTLRRNSIFRNGSIVERRSAFMALNKRHRTKIFVKYPPAVLPIKRMYRRKKKSIFEPPRLLKDGEPPMLSLSIEYLRDDIRALDLANRIDKQKK